MPEPTDHGGGVWAIEVIEVRHAGHIDGIDKRHTTSMTYVTHEGYTLGSVVEGVPSNGQALCFTHERNI
jgi:hypothetical protein